MKSDILFLDDNDNVVEQDQATHAIVRDYDEVGNLIKETFAKIGPMEASKELTAEDLKLIAEFDEKYGSSLSK